MQSSYYAGALAALAAGGPGGTDAPALRRPSRPGEPRWWDEFAVPRYCEFSPDACADIYAIEIVLLRIACQSCKRRFDVALSKSRWPTRYPYEETLRAKILDGSIHYGDPPNAQCCDAGPTMNCFDLEILEYWTQSAHHAWERDPSLEIELPDLQEVRDSGTER